MAEVPKKLRRLALASEVFTPGAPIHDIAMLAGRRDQIMTLFSIIGQRGQHGLIYGERGVGKTSVANLMGEIFSGRSRTELTTERVACGLNATYASLWHSISVRLMDELEEHEIRPDKIVRWLGQREGRTVLVIDEFDRFDDQEGISAMADTIKALSDEAVPTTLILVGVGDSVIQLIGDHQSVRRALVQVRMPRMSRAELAEIIDRGLNRLSMSIADDAKKRIARLSEGLPSYTHLLARHAASRAIEDDRDQITMTDVDIATREAMAKDQHSLLEEYSDAVRSPRSDAHYADVLLACALAPKDPLGYFAPGSVRAPLSRILGRDMGIANFTKHLKAFTEEPRHKVLEVKGDKHQQSFRFSEPIMQPFVIIKGLADGRITEDVLRELQREQDAEGESNLFA